MTWEYIKAISIKGSIITYHLRESCEKGTTINGQYQYGELINKDHVGSLVDKKNLDIMGFIHKIPTFEGKELPKFSIICLLINNKDTKIVTNVDIIKIFALKKKR